MKALAISILLNLVLLGALAYNFFYDPIIATLTAPSGKTYILGANEVSKVINERHGEETASDQVGRLLITLAAQEEHLNLDSKELEERYQQWLSEPGTRSRLDAGDLNEGDLRSQLTTLVLLDQITWSQFTAKEQDEKLKKAFTDDHQRFEELHLKHIIVESRKQADDLLDRLEAGVDFGELAKRFSLDPLTKDRAGDLGWKTRADLSSELRGFLFQLPVGAVSSPIASSSGWHVFLVEDRKDSFADCKTIVKRQLASQLRPETLENLRKKYKVVRSEGADLQKRLSRKSL